MEYGLRYYQIDAIDALYNHLSTRDDNPCLVLPTGSGKTPVIATICRDAVAAWKGRVLILAHVKELLQQAVEKLQAICPEIPVGLYSAGLNSRQTMAPVIVAGIQSVHKRAYDLGRFDLVLVDECHLIPGDGEGMYQTLLAGLKEINPDIRIVGLTATPYRLNQGAICGVDRLLNYVAYEIGVKELIQKGYLCKLTSKAGSAKIDTSQLHIKAGEYNADEVAEFMEENGHVASACAEIIAKTIERKSVLIFACGINHGKLIANILSLNGHSVDQVYGDTPSDERDRILKDFKNGEIKYLVNNAVLTTGFDAPNIDCVVLLRPTLSAGLYYQMVGRGFRLCAEKTVCLVLDFGENIVRHGPIDSIQINSKKGNKDAPGKECPECHWLGACGYAICPDCGYEFPVKEPEKSKHESVAHKGGIISGEITDETFDVIEEYYTLHEKKGAPPDAPKTMRVEYKLSMVKFVSEWICIEHAGFAGNKARDWWTKRAPDCPFPASAADAVLLASQGNLCYTQQITVRKVAGEKFDSIIGYKLGWSNPDEARVVASAGGNLENVLNEDNVPF